MNPETDLSAQALGQLQGVLLSMVQWIDTVASNLLRPWNAYQILIAAVLFVFAHLLARFGAPRLHNWMRTREG